MAISLNFSEAPETNLIKGCIKMKVRRKLRQKNLDLKTKTPSSNL